MSAVSLGDGREPGQALRWTAVALLIAGVHAGAGWWLVTRAFAPPPPPNGVAGVMVELEPVSVPVLPPTENPKPLAESGPGPDKQVAETLDAPPEAPPPAVDPPLTVAADPPVGTAVGSSPELPPSVAQQKPDPAPPPPAPLPDVVPLPTPAPSDAVLAPPPPRPMPVKKVVPPKPPKPVAPKPDPREIARHESREAAAAARQEARARAVAEARAQRQAAQVQARAARAAATREGGGQAAEPTAPTAAASGAVVSTWRGEVIAHMRAYTPASPNGAAGTVKVAFVVDRGGRIVSASVSSSSGDPQLDQAALGAVRRASPVPAPPPEMGGHIPVGVPVHFN